MKAYVTSIGERTTEICVSQLEKFGFDVIISSAVEPWHQKYRRFLEIMDEDILRVDADVIVNKNIIDEYKDFLSNGELMRQWTIFDFYRNDLWIGQPVAYSKKALSIIRGYIMSMDEKRPETWASRIPEINPYLMTSMNVVGMHGFFQDMEAFKRHLKHKIERKQESHCDFQMAEKILNL